MHAIFSGLSMVVLFLGVVFWLGDEWVWLPLPIFSVLSSWEVRAYPCILFVRSIQVGTYFLFRYCVYAEYFHSLDGHVAL